MQYNKENKRIRLCIITPADFSERTGGAEIQVAYLIEFLCDHCSDIEVFLATRNPVTAYGDKVTSVSWTTGRDKKFKFLEFKSISRALKAINPDVIYQRRGLSYTGIAAAYCRQSGAKLIFHVAHEKNLVPVPFGFRPAKLVAFIEAAIRDYGIRRADRIIAQAEYQANLLRLNYGRISDMVLPNFHPVPELTLEKPANPIRVLWIANFRAFKQPEKFVDLAARFEGTSNIKFIMIGRSGKSEWAQEVKSRIRELKNLQWLGHQDLQEVNRLLEQSHLLVNTSKWEGFPNTFIQAWMRKVPVVSLSVDPDGVLGKEGVGFTCQGSLDECEVKVRKLISDQNLRTEMGERARRFSTEQYSLSNIERLVRLIRETESSGVDLNFRKEEVNYSI